MNYFQISGVGIFLEGQVGRCGRTLGCLCRSGNCFGDGEGKGLAGLLSDGRLGMWRASKGEGGGGEGEARLSIGRLKVGG